MSPADTRRHPRQKRRAVSLPEDTSTELAPEDFYYDGPFLVFTAAFHLKRGYCCGNDCRHCPYDESGQPVPGKGEPPSSIQ